MATTAIGWPVRGAAANICLTIVSRRSEKRASAARPPCPRRMSSRSSRRASSSCVENAAGCWRRGPWLVPAGSDLGALHIRYTEWRAPVWIDPILELRAEVEEEAEDDLLLIRLGHAVVVNERRFVREVTAVL